MVLKMRTLTKSVKCNFEVDLNIVIFRGMTAAVGLLMSALPSRQILHIGGAAGVAISKFKVK